MLEIRSASFIFPSPDDFMSRNFRLLVALFASVIMIAGGWHIFEKSRRKAGAVAKDNESLCEVTVAGRLFQLALDRCVVKGEDGVELETAFFSPATKETLPQRLREMGEREAVFPVLYEEGARGKRHLLTSMVTIRMPMGMSPEEAARKSGLELVEVPEYAPGFAVFRAIDPLAAWEISERLRAQGTWPLVEVQLAQQKHLRTLPNDPLFSSQWHLKFQNQSKVVAGTDINVESVWNFGGTGLRGSGVRVGIVDDGMQVNHPDLMANVDTVNDYDWNGGDDDPSPQSGNPHGTCCAGVVGARGDNNLGVAGVAPESTLVGMRLVGGSATDSMEAQAMAHKNDLIFIKSNSWGPDDNGETLEAPGPLTLAAMQSAVTTGRQGKGTILVWAGGNGREVKDDSNYDGYANSIYTIAVGAIDSQMRQSYYSEPGANLHCVAPSNGETNTSVSITTTDRTGSVGYSSTDYHSNFSGTSASCPVVAGVVALLLEKNPALGWRDVQEIILRSSKRINPSDTGWTMNAAGLRFHHSYGAGLIDAAAAVALAESWVNRMPSLPPVVSTQTTSSSIPDHPNVGITRSFVINAAMRVEQVTVKLSATHTRRGQLAVTLTSPSGMVSQLADVHDDENDHYANWVFSSVRHWGELAQGTWTLHVRDGVSNTSGTLTLAELTLHGAAVPAPAVVITSPSDQSFYLPQQSQSFSLAVQGNVSKVELRQNGSVVATSTTPPFQFTHTPTVPQATYTATAYDTDLFSATSAPVTITLATPFQQWVSGFSLADRSPAADPDGDGFSNEEEFAAQTDPSSAASALRILSLEKNQAGTSITLHWQSVSGVSYQIQESINLIDWFNLGAIVTAQAPITEATRTILPEPVKFFRVRTSP